MGVGALISEIEGKTGCLETVLWRLKRLVSLEDLLLKPKNTYTLVVKGAVILDINK